MAKRKPNNQSGSRNHNKNSTRKPNIKQPLNFQDNAEVKEYDKGKRAGMAAIESGKSDNDPSWYTPSNTLLSNVASFQTDLKIGKPIEMKFMGDGSMFDTIKRVPQWTPGILAFRVIPYTYSEGSATDPINLCASALYTAMQVNSSRNPQYQANDLMLYLMAVSSAYSCLAWGERAYGTVTDNYEMLNDYTPGALTFAQGFNYENVRKNLANFRTAINTFAYQLGSFYLPRDINYVARQVFLYETVYMDANTPKSQYYLYKPAAFLRWVEGTTEGGVAVPTYLEGTTERLENVSVEQWIELMESLVNPLRQSDDIRLMASDLIKAFGLSSSYQLTPIADTFNIKPVYNQEVLMQFENAYIMPPLSHTEGVLDLTLRYTQNTELNRDTITSVLEYSTPIDSASGATWSGEDMIQNAFNATANAITPNEVLLNYHVDNPTPEQIMVSSRLSCIPWNGVNATLDTTNKKAKLSGFSRSGTELIAGAQMFYDSREQRGSGLTGYRYFNISTSMFRYVGNTADAESEFANIFNLLGILDAWDWHPKVNFAIVAHKEGNNPHHLEVSQFVYDLETWLKISNDEWDNMNLIALYGLFECTLGEVPKLR